jgi:hypothetical protein
MKVPENYYDEIFEFTGLWEQQSRCGLKILEKNSRKIIIVTELYQDNPGSSVTQAGENLLKQICQQKGLIISEITYLECTPNTNSVLSFYDEQYFEVIFNDNKSANYRKLSKEEIYNIYN